MSKTTRETRETRNGINKPLRGLCLVVWEALDAATAADEVTSKHELAENLGIRPGLVGIIRAQHKQFHAKTAGKQATASKKVPEGASEKNPRRLPIKKGGEALTPAELKKFKAPKLSDAAMQPGGASA
jgi:hypothetical protein